MLSFKLIRNWDLLRTTCLSHSQKHLQRKLHHCSLVSHYWRWGRSNWNLPNSQLKQSLSHLLSYLRLPSVGADEVWLCADALVYFEWVSLEGWSFVVLRLKIISVPSRRVDAVWSWYQARRQSHSPILWRSAYVRRGTWAGGKISLSTKSGLLSVSSFGSERKSGVFLAPWDSSSSSLPSLLSACVFDRRLGIHDLEKREFDFYFY